MANFSKSDLIAAVADTTGRARKDVDDIVTAALSVIREETENGKAVAIHGFGRFSIKERPARPGRHPRTGESMEYAASRTLIFKASKTRS